MEPMRVSSNSLTLQTREHGNPTPRLTRDGYTKQSGSPTKTQVFFGGRWRRVYVLQFSNCPSYFIIVNKTTLFVRS